MSSNQQDQDEGYAKQPLDDEAAETGEERSIDLGADEGFEANIDWRIAKSLERLRAQINAMAPGRNKASDGGIGDPAHAKRNSDHNPWVDFDGRKGVVTARDFTHDPSGGCDAGAVAEKLRSSQDPRIKYIIWNRRIANSSPIDGQAAWTWRPYSGSNPHNHHFHISVKAERSLYDDERDWSL